MGAGVGLKPQDIYDMEMWEFNAYCEGYKEKLKNEQISLIKQSYYTGMFSRDSKQKPKPLEHYINQIERSYNKEKFKDVKVDVELSRNIEKKIEELKKKQRSEVK